MSVEKYLTIQQRKFADKYFETGNGTQSALFACYSVNGAGVRANELLKNSNVQEYLKSKLREYKMNMKEAFAKAGLNAEMVAEDIMEVREKAKKGETNFRGTYDANLVLECDDRFVKWTASGEPEKTETIGDLRVGLEELVQRIQEKKE